jgi:hypothetical protein
MYVLYSTKYFMSREREEKKREGERERGDDFGGCAPNGELFLKSCPRSLPAAASRS